METEFLEGLAICIAKQPTTFGCEGRLGGHHEASIVSHPSFGHGTLRNVQIRSKLLAAAASAMLTPWSLEAQTAPPTPANTAGPMAASAPIVRRETPALQPAMPANSSVTLPQQPAPNPLPQDPSALLGTGTGTQATGLVHLTTSSARYVPASTVAGPGGYAVEQPTAGPLALSLDDAISLGLERNIRLKYQKSNQELVRGYTGQVTNAIIPNLNFKAASSAQEIDLVALGFKPSSLGGLLAQYGLSPSSFPSIVKVNTTSVQISLDQVLFNMPDFELYRAIKPEERSIAQTIQDDNDQVVQAVTMAYLQILADQASLQNTIAQESAARLLFDQAAAREQAGVGIRLDTLRAQVAYQQRQQQHVSADAQLDKDGIQLNRIMGIPAGQSLDLTDPTPYSEIADLTLEQARDTAYAHRSDLLSLDSSIEVAGHELRAIRYQRLPTLGINGFYGILGQDTGLFHGVFTAEGSLRFPIFREAAQRGEEQSASAQIQTLHEQESNLRATIDASIRTAVLDINSANQLVKVSQSNVTLAEQELSDARDRFTAGVADNLEVVDALADVTSAQSQLVSALYRYNTAKVGLARNLGLIQTRYHAFLGI